MVIGRLTNFSDEVAEGRRRSFRVEEERVERGGWIHGKSHRGSGIQVSSGQ